MGPPRERGGMEEAMTDPKDDLDLLQWGHRVNAVE